MLFVCHPQKHCLRIQFLLGVKWPQEQLKGNAFKHCLSVALWALGAILLKSKSVG